MRRLWILLFLVAANTFAGDLKQSRDEGLAHLLATMDILYESKSFPLVKIIESWDAISECSGTVESCPNARLLITSSMGDLNEAPLLYELPKAKGWQLISTQENEDQLIIKLETTLDQANITTESRNKWHSQKITLKVSKFTGLVSSE